MFNGCRDCDARTGELDEERSISFESNELRIGAAWGRAARVGARPAGEAAGEGPSSAEDALPPQTTEILRRRRFFSGDDGPSSVENGLSPATTVHCPVTTVFLQRR